MPDHLSALIPDSPSLPATGDGPLTGVDIVVKDCFAVEGHRSSFGLARWRETHEPAGSTSAVVTKLLAAGGQIVGMAQLDQLAFSLIGNVCEAEPPRNTRHPDLHSGGSSSGSAAAVAGGLAAVGIGTDTVGSVRVPAALCGIHALRPTWGSIDMTGCLPLAASFDTAGILAANPAAMRRTLSVLTESGDDSDRGGAKEPLQAVLVDPELAAPDPSGLISAAGAVAEVIGSSVRTVKVSHLINPDVGRLFGRIQGREVWRTLGAWATANADALDRDVASRLATCRTFAEESPATVDVDMRDRVQFAELLGEVVPPGAVLVLPVLGRPGPRVDDPPDALAAFRRDTIPLMAPAGLAGWPEATWSRQIRREPTSRAIGLLGRPGTDRQLVDLLSRLWASDAAAATA